MKTLIFTYIILLSSFCATSQVANLFNRFSDTLPKTHTDYLGLDANASLDTSRVGLCLDGDCCDSLKLRCELLQFALHMQAAEVDSIKSLCADAIYEYMLQVDSLQRKLKATYNSTMPVTAARSLPEGDISIINPLHVQAPCALASCYQELSGYRERLKDLQTKSTTYKQLLFICLLVLSGLMLIIFVYLINLLKK